VIISVHFNDYVISTTMTNDRQTLTSCSRFVVTVALSHLAFRRPLQVTVCPMLSDRCPVLSATLVYCSQTLGRIMMSLGIEVGLGPGHIVLDEDWAPLWKGALQPLHHFSADFALAWSPISATAELLVRYWRQFFEPQVILAASNHHTFTLTSAFHFQHAVSY